MKNKKVTEREKKLLNRLWTTDNVGAYAFFKLLYNLPEADPIPHNPN